MMEKLRMLQKEGIKEYVTVLKTGMTIFVLSINKSSIVFNPKHKSAEKIILLLFSVVVILDMSNKIC